MSISLLKMFILAICFQLSFLSQVRSQFVHNNALKIDSSHAQLQLDFSTRYLRLEDSVKKDCSYWLYPSLSKFVFAFDNRQERIGGTRAPMNGIKIGLELNNAYRIGFGFYGNGSENNQKNYIPISSVIDGLDTINRSIRLAYGVFFGEILLYRDYKWEISLPIALGSGTGEIRRQRLSLDTAEIEEVSGVGIFDIGINGHYKFFPWLGVGTGLGIREAIHDNDLIDDAYSNPYLDFKLKIFLGYLYKGIFKPEVIKQEKEEYLQLKKTRKERREARRLS